MATTRDKTILCSACAQRDEDGRIIEKGRHATAEEARACSRMNKREFPARVAKRAKRDILTGAIKHTGLTSDHFTKAGLKHIADLFDLSTDGTKDALAERIREVL